jgi:hypothetical protein
MKFGTAINCIDGRVQYPVLDYLNKHFDLEFFDAPNEAGPLHILTDRSDQCRLNSLKEQIRVSVEEHGSRLIALVGHHDCAGNPVTREIQEKQINNALAYLRRVFGKHILYVGLYVNEQWKVEEYTRIEPET